MSQPLIKSSWIHGEYKQLDILNKQVETYNILRLYSIFF